MQICPVQFQLGLFKAFRRALHLIIPHPFGHLIDLLFGITDQLFGNRSADFRISRDNFHFDQAFGRIIGNLHIAAVNLIGGGIGGIGIKPLDRINRRVGILGAKADIGVQTLHRFLALQIALHGNAVLRPCHRRAT